MKRFSKQYFLSKKKSPKVYKTYVFIQGGDKKK